MLRIVIGLVVCVVAGGAAAVYYAVAPDKAVAGYQDPTTRDVDDGNPLPKGDRMEELAKADPIAFLENCLRRYNRDVKTGYSLTMRKQERIDGELNPKEIIKVHFREDPHSVHMEWQEGARLAKRVVYVKDQNDNLVLVKSRLLGIVVKRNPEGEDARKSGRYTLPQFGLKKATQRTLATWDAAKKKDALFIEYLGKKKVKEAGNRECYVLKRSKYAKPENDGITELTLFVDTQTWLQVGSILKDKDGKLIAEYFFRDVEIDPKLDDNQFTREALSR